MIRCVVFDFDGTLIESNTIKQKTFYTIAANVVGGPELMSEILARPDVGDRYEIFNAFTDKLGQSQQQAAAFAQAYSARCAALIAQAPFMTGVLIALNTLRGQGRTLFINSATPQGELQSIVHNIGLDKFITYSYGRPNSKLENLKIIMDQTSITPHEMAMVGDGVDDRESAEQCGCRFISVFEGRGLSAGDPQPLQDLSMIPALLCDCMD